MTPRRWVALAVMIAVLVAAGVVAVVAGSHPAPGVALPDSMASAGDSITVAFDLDAANLLRASPAESWSTGSDPAVRSQYQRIVAVHAALAGHQFNDAQVGAKMAALAGQLGAAAAQHADYVTVLMGANDLCTPSVASMTPTAPFATQFDHALAAFFAADPAAHVFVSSIPDLFRLWSTLRSDPRAEVTWALGRICPSLLGVGATAADRRAVVAQEQADNATLATVCRGFRGCHSDGGAVYREGFSPVDISPVDYFHPSLSGQQALAAVTWAAGYWRSRP